MKTTLKHGSLWIILLFSSLAAATSIDWSGAYRFEYVEIDQPSFESGSRKGYALNHLVLSPKIIAADGFNIFSQFQILNSQNPDYANSQLGEVWGPGVGTGTPTNKSDSTSLSENQPATALTVSQLYLLVNQEFGSIIVGRAPVQFGLGITHNAGQDAFAHWYDTRDMVAYKVHIGNLFIMPSFSKIKDGKFQQGGDTSINTLHFEYNNPENGNQLGLFYETKTSTVASNDAPTGALGGTVVNGRWYTTSYNFLLGKSFDPLDFKVEAGFQSGSTGVADGATSIGVNSYAVVGELKWKPNSEGKFWQIKFGSVSGDDPGTKNYEGFLLDPNYDIAFLMFNHQMGQADIFKTSLARTSSISGSADDEVLSNAIFFVPSYTQPLNSKWDMKNTLAWAQLNNANIDLGAGAESISADVGLEWDLSFVYKANSNVTWKNDIGFFFPGQAFAAGSANLDTDTVIGVQSSAAITF